MESCILLPEAVSFFPDIVAGTGNAGKEGMNSSNVNHTAKEIVHVSVLSETGKLL